MSHIVRAERRPCHNHKSIRREAGHRKVTFDSAAGVQHLCVNDCTNWFIKIIIAKCLQEITSSRSQYFDLREGCLIEEAGQLACGAVLGGDGWRPVVERPAVQIWDGRGAGILLVRREPVWSFPSTLFA